jgi:hypothetical protein
MATKVICKHFMSDTLSQLRAKNVAESCSFGGWLEKGMDERSKRDPRFGVLALVVLSIEIKGPSRPQLTLVDIPDLPANATKGVIDVEVKMVAEITDRCISQSLTICLAVISAINDHANQPILTKIRQYDPDGDPTLGIITKPDRPVIWLWK